VDGEGSLTYAPCWLSGGAFAAAFLTTPSIMSRPDASTLTDEQLMDRYCAGEVSAFTELFRRYAPRVTRFVTPLVGTGQASDVAQVAFLKVHERRDRFHAGARFSTWLFAIARNEAIDVLRRPAHSREQTDQSALLDAPAEVSGPHRRDPLADARVRRAVAALPDEQREVVLLHWFAEVMMDDVAQILGISHDAARRRASRAYATLREHLGEIHAPT
jgi:RNA polymerase sigma-70 factor (ECF subfamily)